VGRSLPRRLVVQRSLSDLARSLQTMGAARRRSRRASNSGGFGALFALLVVVAIIIKFIWWILGALALVGLFFLARAVVRENRKRRDTHARYCAQIAARADQQHNWVMQGDDRGVYGPDGATLMHFIDEPPRAS
jgi:Flp pilus assembly protein TadB